MKKTLLLSLIVFLSTFAFGQTITLSGSGTDVDGTISAYQWRKITGPASGVITNSTSATTTVTGLSAGIYQFELTVTDNQGATGSDTMQVTVLPGNVKPKANAGADQIITLPSTSTILRGINTDVAGNKNTYKWSRIGTLNPGIIVSANNPKSYVINMYKTGGYFFELKVTDSRGNSAADTAKIQVYPKRS